MIFDDDDWLIRILIELLFDFEDAGCIFLQIAVHSRSKG